MIRGFKTEDLEPMMNIWLETNMQAHDFIPKSYWQNNKTAVERLLPDAVIIVYEDGDAVAGFVGLLGNYIAGIFVDRERQSRGIGKALLDHVKENYAELSLHAYKKNDRAVNFYKRENFVVLKETVDENTGETELVMHWTKRIN